MKRILMLMSAALLASSAMAIFIEPENSVQIGLNDTRAAATTINRGSAPWADVGVLSLGAPGSDVDWFAIRLLQGEVLTAITTPLAIQFDSPDTVMALFDAQGNQALVYSDDAGPDPVPDLGSAFRFAAPTTATYYIAVTGWHSSQSPQNSLLYYSEAHGEVGSYALTVSVVPEPGSIIAIGTGLVGLLGLRRRK